MNNNEKIEKYLQLMEECRKVSSSIDSSLDDEELINKIKDAASIRFNNMIENKKILNELIFNRDIKTLTLEDINTLNDFSNKVFAYSQSKDAGLYYAIHKLLREYAIYKNDEELIIKETYNTAIGLFYINAVGNGTFKLYYNEITNYFVEVIDKYFKNYESYSNETRLYLLKCLGNRKLCMTPLNKEEVLKYLEIFNDTMNVFNSQYYRNLNSEFPFDNLIYSMHLGNSILNAFLRKKKITEYNDFDKKVADIVYESTLYVYSKQKNFDNDDARLQNWKVGYYMKASLYHKGIEGVGQVIEYLYDTISLVDKDDYSPKGLREIVKASAYMIEYSKFLTSDEHKSYDNKIESMTNKALNYVSKMSERNYPFLVNDALSLFTLTQVTSKKDANKEILDYIIYSHKPTYIHSLMVAVLGKKLASYMVDLYPEKLIEVLDLKNEEEVIENKEKIINYVFTCGLYHDVGKTIVLSYVGTYERGLLDEEFECVKNHTTFGYETLNNINEHDLAIVALYHHKYFDGFGGYPKNVNECPKNLKPIVDIITIADCLDAATDFIGRSYKVAKTLDTVIGEFEAKRGTQYSPVLVDILEDSNCYNDIKFILNEERKNVYLAVYKNKKYQENVRNLK